MYNNHYYILISYIIITVVLGSNSNNIKCAALTRETIKKANNAGSFTLQIVWKRTLVLIFLYVRASQNVFHITFRIDQKICASSLRIQRSNRPFHRSKTHTYTGTLFKCLYCKNQ